MTASLDDLAAFATAFYGDNTGTAHWAVGIGGHRNGSGKYEFDSWSPREFAYPSMTGRPYRDMLAAAANSDVHINPYLMNGSKRTKVDAVNLALIHRDWDGELADLSACLERVAALGGFAVMSGTPGHLQVYLPLAQPVTQAAHRQLSEALADYLPPGCDRGKKPASDMLRPPGTFNRKPTVNGADPAPVVWAIPPTGALLDPDSLARLLPSGTFPESSSSSLPQVNPRPCVPPGRTNAPELPPSTRGRYRRLWPLLWPR
jgi:putative DNA primase/helicase